MKLECDEVDILEHTEELLKELGPEVPHPSETEQEEGEGEGGVLEDSESELFEESTENMELS